MRFVFVLAGLSFVVVPLSPAFAQTWPAYSAEKAGSSELQRCLGDEPSGVQEGACLTKEFAREDRRMNESYIESLKGASVAEKLQRKKAQQAWLVFRRENCQVRRMNSGSGAGVFYIGCLVRETIQRRSELTENWDY